MKLHRTISSFTLIFLGTIVFLGNEVFAQTLPELSRQYHSTEVRTEGNRLIVSTGKAQRIWEWTGNGLATISLKSQKTNKEWLSPHSSKESDWDLGDIGKGELISLKAYESNDDNFTSWHLAVEAIIKYDFLNVKYVIWAYPGSSGFRTQLWLKNAANVNWQNKNLTPGVSNRLTLAEKPDSIVAFGYMAGYKNHMEKQIIRQEKFKPEKTNDWANGLVISQDHAGMIMIKESHKHIHMEHGELATGAFIRNGRNIKVTGLGLNSSDLKTESYRFCWANWLMMYEGNRTDARFALKRFDRQRFPVVERDIFIMANTWGAEDRRPECLYKAREANILNEIKSCADLGIDILQIDDGWQKGNISKMKGKDYSKLENWLPGTKRQDKFTLHNGKKFEGTYDIYPNGFGKVRAKAATLGVDLGLWFHWKAPFESLKINYNDGNFKAIKLDFASLKTKDQFDEMYYKARKFIKYTHYTSVVNWDVTETFPRMGYFFGRDVGNLYLYNRKLFARRWSTLYTPWKSLRDAWHLSKYLNLNTIQVTFQNKDLTPQDARTDASKYPHTYNLGITLMSSPIFFTETQYLDEEARQQIKSILKPYKSERFEIYEGYVFPIGKQPDNSSWTGFQNYHPRTHNGYITIFRERKNNESSAKIGLKFYKPGTRMELTDLRTGEVRNVTLDKKGRISFNISEAPGFRFFKIRILDS